MKKHLFLSLALVATACAESAVVSAPNCIPNHGGFYAGLGVGASMATVETDAASLIDYALDDGYDPNGTSFSSKTIKKTKAGFSGGIKFGYGFQFNEFYVAPEAEFIMHAGKKIKDTITMEGNTKWVAPTAPVTGTGAATSPFAWTTPGTDGYNSKMKLTGESKLRYTGNFAVKFGYVFGNSLAYLKSGVSLVSLSNKLNFSNVDTINENPAPANATSTPPTTIPAAVTITGTAPQKSKNTTHVGWLIGGGYEYAITKNIVGFADVSCSFYNSKDISVGDEDAAKKITVKPKTVTTALVGIKYKI
jgi:opacity protein-like surface antigen